MQRKIRISKLLRPYWHWLAIAFVVRITTDIDAVQDFVSSALLGIVIDVLALVGMLAVMFYLDRDFTLIALSVAPILLFVAYSYTHRIKKATRAVKKKASEIVSVVQESLTSMRVIKAFAQKDYEEERLDKESLESVDMALRARRIKAKLSPSVDITAGAEKKVSRFDVDGICPKDRYSFR